MTVTTAFIVYVQLKDDTEKTIIGEDYTLFFVALILALLIEIAIVCWRKNARKVPLNYILLTVFTISLSILVAYITIPFDPQEVILAWTTTALTTFALTLYALTTKKDMTMCGGSPFIFTVALFMIFICLKFF